ncbi:hypothetical protein BCR43DRAFT_448835 [Syncephalastrum racemosum]|uniref:Zn(2)-C6 fungal-type domain-containing protein n=1 Tax=Syncephalastrum racemosum TaxID=13706 RepID=A0A1X2HRI0_SYNRA|nr:hypothetical protein BCR43DRAFT_448835 [Syncephalastrum racemosum]
MSTTNADDFSAKPRRKKATRACSHCQKAHLTCDDSRPCQRCIKRGLENTCTDGTRKRAKYLQDDDFEQQQARQQQQQQPPPPAPAPQQHPQVLPPQQPAAVLSPVTTGPSLASFQPADFSAFNDQQLMNVGSNYGFGSESANLEYGVLSNMLQLNGFLEHNPHVSFLQQSQPQQQQQQPHRAPTHASPFGSATGNSSNGLFSPMEENVSSMVMHGISSPSAASPSAASPGSQVGEPFYQQPQTTPVEQPLVKTTAKFINKRRKGFGNTPQETYTSIKQPFNYAEGYHYLFQHLRQRMSREDLMRITRALALFRPSFISAMIHLTEEDLIYMEKCVQRTLLEYEKLISFSGTPTAVWRRTGEIVVVGKEFSLLTQWSKEVLLGKKTFIYELMDNGSAVEYWEKYSEHAFSDTESSVYISVILMSPTYRPVPCSFCFTIKRDIFDLPSVVVGNFLPILSGSNF